MPLLLATAPYPFHLATARELHMVLTQLYPAAKAALFAAQKVGIGPWQLNADQAPYLVWKDLLELAANTGLTRDLVSGAAAEFPRSPLQPFLAALLAGQQPVSQAEPRAADGAPAFRHGDDEVSEPEALLFHDDLTLSAGRLPWLIGVLNRLMALAPAVCRLEVACAAGTASGTGFRIGPDLLLTNWHVLYPEGNAPTAITATFGYEEDAAGVGLAGTALGCEVASVQAHQDDDWGIVRVSAPMAQTIPVLSLADASAASLQSSAFIIQHPAGQRKRVAYARNRVTYFDTRVVQYLSDTQEGSSGSPVFDDQGRLIALHHAGGRPQEVAGRAPLRKNEGITIARVAGGLKQIGVAL